MPEELWKDVVGYEDLFKVSNMGKVFSKRSGRVLKQFLHKNGYCTVSTKIGGRGGTCKNFKVHRLVAEAFLNPPSEQILKAIEDTKYGVPLVNHIDGVKTNNIFTNLEWSTYEGNTKHAFEIGLVTNAHTKGARNYGSFYPTEEDRKKAYEDFVKSGLSRRKYADQYSVSHNVISRLVRDYEKQ